MTCPTLIKMVDESYNGYRRFGVDKGQRKIRGQIQPC